MPSVTTRGAVLDLGSNTFKLLLAEQTGGTLRIDHEKAYPVRLGEGVARTGRLHPSTCRRAIRVLGNLERKILAYRPDRTVAVATGTLRRAKNAKSFLSPASRILHTRIQLLTGHEEGRLIALAARALSHGTKPRFHIDLGGGSLEVIDSAIPHRPRIVSLNLGCVAVRDSLLPSHPPAPDQWEKALALIRRSLKRVSTPARPARATFSGGTGHAYACLWQKKNVKARKLEGFVLTQKNLEKLLLRILPLSLRQLKALPGMPSDRASVALPAFLVLRETMAKLKLSQVRLTTHGLRYGVWLHHLATAPVRKIKR